MADIPVQPKREPEIPIQPKQRRSIWPWVVGLLALLLIPLFFMRDREPDTAVVPDTSSFVDTSARVGARTTGTAAGTVTRTPADSAPSRATPLRDTSARADTTVPTDTTSRRP